MMINKTIKKLMMRNKITSKTIKKTKQMKMKKIRPTIMNKMIKKTMLRRRMMIKRIEF